MGRIYAGADHIGREEPRGPFLAVSNPSLLERENSNNDIVVDGVLLENTCLYQRDERVRVSLKEYGVVPKKQGLRAS